MTENNLLQGYNWDASYEDLQHHHQNSRQRDEVISVYEIFVKDEEENIVSSEKINTTIINDDGDDDDDRHDGLAISDSTNQLIQNNCVIELGETLETELIRPITTATTGISAKDISIDKYRILDRNIAGGDCNSNNNDDNNDNNNNNNKLLPFSQNSGVQNQNQLVDKDDPRSRLHFVKYLKRDGKTFKIWECGICSKEFRHQYTLMRHLPTHTDERNFKCETCGKAFRQLSTLSQHRAIHSDARPYVCEYCKKTFNRVSTLISHRKTHSDDKPHKCQVCGKGFHQKGNLRNHVFTHTNERPYKCALCGKGFNQMSNLMCHKLKSHAHIAKSLPYACSICGKEFLRRFALRSHEERKHGIKYSQNKSNANIVDQHQRGINPKKSENMIVDHIQTKAMEDAVILGQTPFALFKPVKGIPILVKVSSAVVDGKQILSPATPEDLKSAGKMCHSPLTVNNDSEGVKTVQIKVPVVATITQILDDDGNFELIVEPPEPDQDQESHTIETQFSCSSQVGNDDDNKHDNGNGNRSETVTSDLLTLGETDCSVEDVQYIRATEDGRYEMMTNSEAIDLMSQNCHDVTILNDVDVAAMSFNDNNNIVVDHNDLRLGKEQQQQQQYCYNHKNIEVFGDKDFRILGSRDDSRLMNVDDNISLLEQSKIDDFILGSRNCNDQGGINDDDEDDDEDVDDDDFNSSSSLIKNHVNVNVNVNETDDNDFEIFNNCSAAGSRRFFH